MSWAQSTITTDFGCSLKKMWPFCKSAYRQVRHQRSEEHAISWQFGLRNFSPQQFRDMGMARKYFKLYLMKEAGAL